MPSYVEEAILRVRDQSTRQIRSVNRALADLFRTARNARNLRINLAGLDRAEAQARSLRQELERLARPQTIRINLVGEQPVRSLAALLDRIDGTRNLRLNLAGDTAARVNSLAAELRQLDARRFRVSMNSRDLLTAIDRARRLDSLLTGMAARTPVLPSPWVPPANDPRRYYNDPDAGRYGRPTTTGNGVDDFIAGMNRERQPYNLGRIVVRNAAFEISGEIYLAARQVVMTAANAPLNMEDAVTQVRARGTSQEDTDFLVNEISIITSGEGSPYRQVPDYLVLEAVTDVVGQTDDRDVWVQSAERIARNTQLLVAGLNLPFEQAADEAREIEKILAQRNVLTDPVEAERWADQLVRAAVATKDILPSEMRRAGQQMGTFRTGVSPEGFLETILVRDEGGMRSSGEFRQMYNEFLRSTLADYAKEAQTAAGLRLPGGGADPEILRQIEESPLTFANEVLRPLLEAQGRDMESAADIGAGMSELGVVTQGAVAQWTNLLINGEQLQTEINKAGQIDPQFLLNNPTTRGQARAIRAQFENLMADLLGPINENIVGPGLGLVVEELAAARQTETRVDDAAAAMAGVVPLALAAALEGLSDPDTRALSAAGLALTGSAVALTNAAEALGAAAGADVGGRNRRNGFLGWLGRMTPWLALTTLGGSTPGGGGNTDEARDDLYERLGENPPAPFWEQMRDYLIGEGGGAEGSWSRASAASVDDLRAIFGDSAEALYSATTRGVAAAVDRRELSGTDTDFLRVNQLLELMERRDTLPPHGEAARPSLDRQIALLEFALQTRAETGQYPNLNAMIDAVTNMGPALAALADPLSAAASALATDTRPADLVPGWLQNLFDRAPPAELMEGGGGAVGSRSQATEEALLTAGQTAAVGLTDAGDLAGMTLTEAGALAGQTMATSLDIASQGASGALTGAFAVGAETVAAAIRAALATPVNVNTNINVNRRQNPGQAPAAAAPLDTGYTGPQ